MGVDDVRGSDRLEGEGGGDDGGMVEPSGVGSVAGEDEEPEQ